MTEVKSGDRVRVVLEGVARVEDDSPNFILGEYGVDNYITQRAEHVKSVEVLSRSFKVGDTVRDGDYEKLPIGTVVKDRHDTRVKVMDKKWRALGKPSDLPQDFLSDPRTIVFLP